MSDQVVIVVVVPRPSRLHRVVRSLRFAAATWGMSSLAAHGLLDPARGPKPGGEHR